jgi:chromosome partitioning protein
MAVVNQKGGSGKTTTTVNLAAALGEMNRQVLVVDLDPQASASSWYRVSEEGRGLLGTLTERSDLNALICTTEIDGVSIVPATRWLMAADKLLAGEEGAESRLVEALQQLNEEEWDYLLLDCPPTLGILTVNALAAATEVLIPVETHVLPLHGLAQLLETIEVVRERLNGELEIAGILACRVDRRTRLSLEIVEDLRQRFENLVYATVIRENIRLAEAPSFGLPITLYSNRSAGAQDYRSLAGDVLAQEETLEETREQNRERIH